MVVAMFIICVPYFVLNVYFAKANFNLQFDQIHDQRASSYLDACFTNRRYLPEIITLGLSPYLRKRWNAIGTGLISQNMALLKRRNKSELVMIVFVFLGKGGISLYIIVRCLQYASFYTVGQIMMYIQSFSGGINALAGVMQQLSGIYEGSCFLQNYQRFIEVKKTSNCASIPKLQVPEEIESFECRGVGFIYPGSSTCALENINLTFKKGESTLLIGRNGAGKTTLARLLVGLYVPTTGQILVNGHDMREYDLPLLRKKISMLFQDFVRYALTAGENIGVGCIEHIGDRRRVVSAAKAARVEEIIGRLPNGYGTMLGKEFRGGQDLSLGEWQRLCLARLFMREASLIVYDEPTASLDVETESDLLREIALSAKSRICILVSHRMLRSDIANRIVVLENGRIVEIGNHDQLVTCGGRYAHLWHLYHRLGSDNGDCGAD